MDKKLIEQLAAEADPGFMYGKESDGTMLDSLVGIEAIYRFAALVVAHERERIAAQFEAQPHMEHFGREIGDAIRAGGAP